MTVTEPTEVPDHEKAVPRVASGGPRATAAALAGASAAAGLLGALPLHPALSAILVAFFAICGPGAAVSTWVVLPRPTRLAAVPTLSLSIVTLTTIVAAWSLWWQPTLLLLLMCAAVAASSAFFYHRTGIRPDAQRTIRRWERLAENRLAATRALGFRVTGLRVTLVLCTIALIVWAVAMPGLPGTEASFYGLLFSGSGRLLIPATLLTALAAVVAIATRSVTGLAVATGTAIVVARVTTWVGTEIPLYDWTYKHLAIVDFIHRYGSITPDGTDIYAQWPAFFAVSTWFTDATGLDPILLAHLFAPVIHVLVTVIVFSAARTLGMNRVVAMTAAFIVEAVNWVGQDYFAPQAWAFVLAYGLIALLLASPRRPSAALLAILPFAAIVPTHQLTPFWVLGAAVLLVIFRRIRPWWAVAIMAALAGGYLLMNLEAVAPYGILSGGSPIDNAASNFTMAGVRAKEVTSMVCRGLSAGVVLAAAICAVIGWRRRRPHTLTLAILAFSSLALLLGQSYGGEAIFRVYLYALLGCGLLIAPVLVGLLTGFGQGLKGFLRATGAAVLVCAAALSGMYSYTALWPVIVQTRVQYEAIDAITSNAEEGTRFISMHPAGLPTRSNANYAWLTLKNPYFDYPLSFDLAGDRMVFPTPEQLGDLFWKVEQSDKPTVVTFTEQSRRISEYYGTYRPGAPAKLEAALREAPGWRVLYDHDETVIFIYEPK
ncbi:hypothetical protein [Gordonia westfalica]|uniref:4-amino-4-deoxy-L-arabinose transferase n=1 Tax=Gordonia westfalica TaxID=158898 RepID=A0A1H2LMM9_9ACTN|nr:hypothetical protein [Gordonia westfalica]SDU82084.1 hypothetical protein SAMN04488548_136598 [Gordonia westfalica]